jgi:hypothetical protein
MSQCEWLARYDNVGRLVKPRRCRHPARVGSAFCGVHRDGATRPIVTLGDGGFCVWCGKRARRYECNRFARLPVDLCDDCAKALMEAIQTTRPRRSA